MPIENRELKARTRLVARYKGQERTLEAVQTADGLRYRLDDGQEFKSPSSAGKAVMGGVACNGWRFWSLAGEEPQRRPRKQASAKPKKASANNKTAKPAKKRKGKMVRAASRGSYGCGACGETLRTQKAAVEHALTHTS